MTRILQKTQQETRQRFAFESHSGGCLLLLGCLILSDPILGKNSLFYSEDNTEVNSWLNLIVMTLNVAQIKQVLKQGQQLIQEQNSITSTQKKRLSDKWHKRLTSYLGLANQGSSNDPKHFGFGLRCITKMRDKKNIFFPYRLLESLSIASPQDPVYSVDEQRPLLYHSNFF